MLHNIQDGFKEFIENRSISDVLAEQVVQDGISADKRLGVYYNNVVGNLTEALKIAYPNFVKLVGEEFFDFIASKYIPNNLPKTGVLYKYGESFSEFLKDIPQLEQFPYASDFAKMEWLYHSCGYQPDEKTLTLNKLAQIAVKNPEYMPRFKNSVVLFHSLYPIGHIWEMCIEGKEEALKDGNSHILIYQKSREANIISLTEVEFRLFNELKGYDVDVSDISAEQASQIIQKFINLGVFQDEV